jgi:hypothetical protein
VLSSLAAIACSSARRDYEVAGAERLDVDRMPRSRRSPPAPRGTPMDLSMTREERWATLDYHKL